MGIGSTPIAVRPANWLRMSALFACLAPEFHSTNEPQNRVDGVVSQGDARKVETFMEESRAFADRSRERDVLREIQIH